MADPAPLAGLASLASLAAEVLRLDATMAEDPFTEEQAATRRLALATFRTACPTLAAPWLAIGPALSNWQASHAHLGAARADLRAVDAPTAAEVPDWAAYARASGAIGVARARAKAADAALFAAIVDARYREREAQRWAAEEAERKRASAADAAADDCDEEDPGCRCNIVRMPPCSWCCEGGTVAT